MHIAGTSNHNCWIQLGHKGQLYFNFKEKHFLYKFQHYDFGFFHSTGWFYNNYLELYRKAPPYWQAKDIFLYDY